MFVWSKLSSSKWADAWEERFGGNPSFSLVITSVPGRPTIRVELYAEKEKPLLTVQRDFGGSVREIKSRNWAAITTPVTPPLQVRGRLVICAARTPAEVAKATKEHPGRDVIAIPADMAFGTGHHATTATVLRLLVDNAARLKGTRWTMADLGCGSGILAIAAAKLGAAKVWGCDFDPQAVKVAKENLERNATPKVKLVRADVLKWQAKELYDIVAANIFYDILEAGFPQIVSAVKPGGILMASGILKEQAPHCLQVATDLGIRWDKMLTKGKWVTAIGTRV